MKKVLIFGKGFLGTKLEEFLSSKGFECLSLSLSSNPKTDISLFSDIENAFSFNPDTVVLTAAISSPSFCEKNKDLAFKTNVEGAKNVSEACKSNYAKLIFFSTDAVFDGVKGNFKETDPINPANYYGYTKAEAEKLVQKLKNSLIIRTSALYGFNPLSSRKTFADFVLNSFNEGKEVEALSDQVFSPTFLDDLCNAVFHLLKEKGVFHCSGSEAISRYSFAQKITQVFNFPSKLVKPITALELNNQNLKASDYSMNISKITKKGIEMHSCTEGLKLLKSQMP